MALITPLGDDALLLRALRGREELGRLFEYEAELLSEDSEVKFQDIVGQNVTVRFPESGAGGAAKKASTGAMHLDLKEMRFINGFVSRFVQTRRRGRLTEYRATIVPWLWFLTRSSDCRIYQDKTVPEIIKDIFRELGFSDIEDSLSGTYRKWEYCVQYRETHFSFISRLMEQEGIYYYFRHENGKHTLVLADSPSAHSPRAGYEEIRFRPPSEQFRETEYIFDWMLEQEVQAGAYAHTDFDFEDPQKSLLSTSKIVREHAVPDFELYDYPGEFTKYPDGEGYARVRIEEVQTRHEVARAQTDAHGMATGATFALADHPRGDQNKDYLITSVELRLESDEFDSTEKVAEGSAFSCSFTAIDATAHYRSARVTARPLITGPQTALVVGPAGEEIYTDKYGRVKVQFHWDRYSAANETSSCWIRVAQVWAGKSWGAMYIPRISQEVIVEFLEGDPDRPIITGRVYNGLSMPPYQLPGEATKSTLKSLSSKGGGGFNEIRFEDKKGEEQIFVHGEKNEDIRIKNDVFEWVGNNRHLIVTKDQMEKVENNRSEVVGADHMEKIGKDRHVKVVGKEALDVGGSHSLTVTGDVIEVFKANHSEQTTQNIYIKGMNVVIEAAMGLTIKCGGNAVVVDTTGVTVKGMMVTIDGTMTKINSGPGSPAGSGSAGSAVSPADPTAAEEADTADPGEMAEVKARQRETKSGKYGSVQFKPFESDDSKKSWIEIKLVDKEGKPVPGERYRLVLPDGQTAAEGTLDEKGFARVDGIDPGQCRVIFPDQDQEAVEPGES